MEQTIRQQREQQFIDHAEQAFFELGYAKTTISAICERAQCSRTTLYTYFESKENIYLAVIIKSFKLFLKYFAKLEVDDQKGLSRILAFSKGYLDFTIAHPKNYQLIMEFYNALKEINSEDLQSQSYVGLSAASYFAEAKKIANLPFALLNEEIKKGQEDGSIGTNTPSETHLINIWAYLVGISRLSTLSGKENRIRILETQVDNWQENALAVIRKMIC